MFRVGLTALLRQFHIHSSKANYGKSNAIKTKQWSSHAINSLSVNTRHYWKSTEIPPKSESAFKLKDNVDDTYRIIYKGPYQTMILGGHYFSFVCYAAVVAAGYYSTTDISFTDNIFIGSYEEFLGFFGLLCLSSFQVTAIVHHYPLRIYCDKKDGTNYIAVFQGLLPWKTSKVHFKAGEVRQIQNLFSGNNIFQLGPKKGYIVPHRFVKTADFTNMTGLPEPVEDDD